MANYPFSISSILGSTEASSQMLPFQLSDDIIDLVSPSNSYQPSIILSSDTEDDEIVVLEEVEIFF